MQRLESQKISTPSATAEASRGWRGQFNLLRWFSLGSFLIIAAVALGLGYISTRFVVTESVERDALLTAQFVQAIGEAEMRHAKINPNRTMGEMLDPREDNSYPDVNPGCMLRRALSFSIMSNICPTFCWPPFMRSIARSSGQPTRS